MIKKSKCTVFEDGIFIPHNASDEHLYRKKSGFYPKILSVSVNKPIVISSNTFSYKKVIRK